MFHEVCSFSIIPVNRLRYIERIADAIVEHRCVTHLSSNI